MRSSHLISDELFTQALDEIQQGHHFVAYNAARYLLDKGDMHFFKDEAQAKEFSVNNISDLDHFQVFKAGSLMAIYDHFIIEQSLQQHNTLFSHLKHNTMEENNYDYLANQLKYTGFGEGLKEELKTKMLEGRPEFRLVLEHPIEGGKDFAVARLDFKKSTEKDMYFFNSYTLNLKIPSHHNELEQKFFINSKQDNTTLKEGLNLMYGRAIEKEITPKEGEKYKAWLQLDFKETDANGNYKTKQFHPNYGFDLEKVLDLLPIREMETPEGKKQLMESLQRGNRQIVTLEAEGKNIKLFVEAAPQFKSLNYYNSEMKRMQSQEVSTAHRQTNGNGQQQDGMKESVKQKASGDDDIDGPKKKRSRRQSV